MASGRTLRTTRPITSLTTPTGRTFVSGNGTAGGAFWFFFSYLPGDYNQDGIVTSADAVSGTVKDGDGDGVIENGSSADDTLLASTTYINTQLSLRKAWGDYDDNETNNATDYTVWRSTYGSTTDLRADGNSDGIVDTADFVTWRYSENTQGAWYTDTMGAGAQLPIVDFGNAPRVANVTISGSWSAHPAYSFDGHDGSGEQLRTVPVGGADTVSITFSEDVNVVVENLRLVGLRTANVPTVVEFSYDIGSMTATWRFDDLVANDHYLISLSDAVTDIEGNRLDGEWVNPLQLTTTNSLVSEFPSGDGNAGGHFNFVMTLLAGDANLDLVVADGDFNILLSNIGILNAVFSQADFTGDGLVDMSDFFHLYTNYGQDLRDTWLLADLDGDLDVDNADMTIFNSHWGMANPTLADGDFNGDGVIDAGDVDYIFHQLGLELAGVA